MDISWAKQADSGNADAGSAQSVLVSLVNDVKHMIESRNSAALSVAFDLLETWLLAHFADEERKAKAANIDFPNRKLEQQFELNELLFLKNGLAAKNGAWSDSEAKLDIQFLSDWLIEHITNEDSQKCQPQTGNGNGICEEKVAFTQAA
ncbi:MAG: hemerythrin family protein [Gallionella sp.]